MEHMVCSDLSVPGAEAWKLGGSDLIFGLGGDQLPLYDTLDHTTILGICVA